MTACLLPGFRARLLILIHYVPQSMQYVSTPLTSFDMIGVSTVGLLYGWTLGTPDFDPAPLDAAASRVVNKWRLLAGEIEIIAPEVRYLLVSVGTPADSLQHPQTPLAAPWAIRIPIGPLPSDFKTHTFHITRLPTTNLDLPTTPLGASEARLLPRPPTKYFSPSGLACTVDSLAKNPAPFLTFQVTILANATCIGLTVPHVVFDAHGAGLIVGALDAEGGLSFPDRKSVV